MVHNGIEYGDMQLISEAYDVLKTVGGLSVEELAAVFDEWNGSELESFLVEITAAIFKKADDAEGGGGWLVDKVLDKTGMKVRKGGWVWRQNGARCLGFRGRLGGGRVFGRVLGARRAPLGPLRTKTRGRAPRCAFAQKAKDLIGFSTVGFEPTTSGLWALHATTAPSRTLGFGSS